MLVQFKKYLDILLADKPSPTFNPIQGDRSEIYLTCVVLPSKNHPFGIPAREDGLKAGSNGKLYAKPVVQILDIQTKGSMKAPCKKIVQGVGKAATVSFQCTSDSLPLWQWAPKKAAAEDPSNPPADPDETQDLVVYGYVSGGQIGERAERLDAEDRVFRLKVGQILTISLGADDYKAKASDKGGNGVDGVFRQSDMEALEFFSPGSVIIWEVRPSGTKRDRSGEDGKGYGLRTDKIYQVPTSLHAYVHKGLSRFPKDFKEGKQWKMEDMDRSKGIIQQLSQDIYSAYFKVPKHCFLMGDKLTGNICLTCEEGEVTPGHRFVLFDPYTFAVMLNSMTVGDAAVDNLSERMVEALNAEPGSGKEFLPEFIEQAMSLFSAAIACDAAWMLASVDKFGASEGAAVHCWGYPIVKLAKFLECLHVQQPQADESLYVSRMHCSWADIKEPYMLVQLPGLQNVRGAVRKPSKGFLLSSADCAECGLGYVLRIAEKNVVVEEGKETKKWGVLYDGMLNICGGSDFGAPQLGNGATGARYIPRRKPLGKTIQLTEVDAKQPEKPNGGASKREREEKGKEEKKKEEKDGGDEKEEEEEAEDDAVDVAFLDKMDPPLEIDLSVDAIEEPEPKKQRSSSENVAVAVPRKPSGNKFSSSGDKMVVAPMFKKPPPPPGAPQPPMPPPSSSGREPKATPKPSDFLTAEESEALAERRVYIRARLAEYEGSEMGFWREKTMGKNRYDYILAAECKARADYYHRHKIDPKDAEFNARLAEHRVHVDKQIERYVANGGSVRMFWAERCQGNHDADNVIRCEFHARNDIEYKWKMKLTSEQERELAAYRAEINKEMNAYLRQGKTEFGYWKDKPVDRTNRYEKIMRDEYEGMFKADCEANARLALTRK